MGKFEQFGSLAICEPAEEHPMSSPFQSIRAGALAVMLACGGHAQAQTSANDRIQELEKKLERSMELIEQLSAKLEKIEKTAASSPAPSGSPQQAGKVEQLEKYVNELSSSIARRTADAGVPVHGFADVGLAQSRENNPTNKGRRGASLGTLDLYLTPQFGDRVKSLIELAFEVQDNGSLESDLERLQIGYTFGDAGTAWLGRFHTPYGYWNTAYHHGAQIQTSITRPRFLGFEDSGGILPAHTTGGWFNGSTLVNAGKIGYDVFLGNAPRIQGVTTDGTQSALSRSNPNGFTAAVNTGRYAGTGTLNPRQGGTTNHANSVGFNAWFEPRSVDGLRLGLHGMDAKVEDSALLTNRTQLNMLGGYAAYLTDPWEIMSEYYQFNNRDLSGNTGKHNSWAAYAQVGYNYGLWTPYGRLERTRLDQKDNYFGVMASGRSYGRGVIGLRYDIDPKAALKFELSGTQKGDLGIRPDTYSDARIQYSIRF
jgi:hypothetical protein